LRITNAQWCKNNEKSNLITIYKNLNTKK